MTFCIRSWPDTVHGGQPPAAVYVSSIGTDQQAQAIA